MRCPELPWAGQPDGATTWYYHNVLSVLDFRLGDDAVMTERATAAGNDTSTITSKWSHTLRYGLDERSQ